MGKFASLIAAFAVFVLVAVVGYVKVGAKTEPANPRTGIEKGIEQVKQTAKLNQVEESLLRVQLAVNDYLIRNQSPPPSLASLVPAYFDAVPVNPETGQPFEYVKTGSTYRIGGPADSKGRTVQAKNDTSTGSDAGVKDGAGKINVSSKGGAAAEADFINPNLIEADSFVYDATGKRDPFQPWDLDRQAEIDPNKSPLEQYDVKQLRLTAVLGDATGGRTALVEDSFGKGYTVKVGTRIGNAGGVTAAIEPGLLKVIETHVDFNGVEKQELVELKIQSSSLTKSDKREAKKGKLSAISDDSGSRRRKK